MHFQLEHSPGALLENPHSSKAMLGCVCLFLRLDVFTRTPFMMYSINIAASAPCDPISKFDSFLHEHYKIFLTETVCCSR